ncbi:glutaredoxin 2 [Aliamphritea hakodatensis]|uniref:glutaredoxin 2 n=1 Tax=Aliamphritea hakodatensis TaxID=2895352 RepID=UPI0022FD99C2|nr:glutaredoxin 2 [Aliamphritea hakodatensis]
MKLYAFNSCPFCVRVITLLGIKNIPCEITYITVGDFPKHLQEQLTGTTVPVLEDPANGILLQDSTEIIRYLDNLNGQPLLKNHQPGEAMTHWLSNMKPSTALLCYPRMPGLNLPELATMQAKAHFNNMISNRLGMPLPEALTLTEKILPRVSQQLKELSAIIDIPAYLQNCRPVSVDDLCAFAELRNLTMVETLSFPESVSAYLHKIAEVAGIHLFSDDRPSG